MRISVFQLVTAVAVLAVLATLARVLVIVYRRERYTREKFAFAALTSFSGMAVIVLSSLAGKQTPWGAVVNLLRSVFGLSPEPEPPRGVDHVLMILVLICVGYFVLRIFENWKGAKSVRQYDKDRYHEPATLITEGLWELERIIKQAALGAVRPGTRPEISRTEKSAGRSGGQSGVAHPSSRPDLPS